MPPVMRIGMPMSRVSRRPRSAAFASSRSAILPRTRARSPAGVLDHVPSYAARAAPTAASISALSPSATTATTERSCGLMLSKRLPERLSTNLPLMKSWYCRMPLSAPRGWALPAMSGLLPGALLKRGRAAGQPGGAAPGSARSALRGARAPALAAAASVAPQLVLQRAHHEVHHGHVRLDAVELEFPM